MKKIKFCLCGLWRRLAALKLTARTPEHPGHPLDIPAAGGGVRGAYDDGQGRPSDSTHRMVHQR